MSNKKSVIIPSRLSVDLFFLNVLSLDKDKMFLFNIEALQSFGYEDIKVYQHPEQGYIFAKGTLPVCLCAHMDKVPWYKSIKKIAQTPVINKKGNVTDVLLSSKQGIGGDDRCGVYAILSMLKLGHRPSVLFCMGEEIGCRGSHKFVVDFPEDFLSDINAFIQIDRRGSNDCVRYSDQNHELTDAICEFNFSPAFGSCTDISVLMPHFGISGVNLSSGYYNEHHASREFVSVKDVKTLLKRLNKILSSDIFNKRYKYKGYQSSYYYDSKLDKMSAHRSRFNLLSNHEQMSLLDDFPYESPDDLVTCDYCGLPFPMDEMTETDNPLVVCPDCAKELLKMDYIKCDSCGKLHLSTRKKDEPSYVVDPCPFCGCINDTDR